MKKFFAILTFCLMIFTCIACDSEPESIDVSGVTFESITVEYDGEAHSIECKNVPNGVKVTYFGNGVRKPGEHKVTAVLKDSNGNEITRLKATITITGEEEPTLGGDDPTQGGDDPVTSIDPADVLYAIEVNGVVYELLEFLDGTLLDGQEAEYSISGLEVYAEDVVYVYYEGEVITNIGPDGNASNVAANEYTPETGELIVRSDCDSADVYFKVWADGGYSLYLSGYSAGGNFDGETLVVYFQNNWNWTDLNIYFYGADGLQNGAFPGVALTEIVGQDGPEGVSYDIYEIVIDLSSGYEGFIVSGFDAGKDGGVTNQTPDILIAEAAHGNCYYLTWDGTNNCNAVGYYTYTPAA